MYRKLEKYSKNAVEKRRQFSQFNAVAKQLAHLHVLTLQLRRAFSMVSRFVCYDFAAKDENAITLAVMGLFGRSKRQRKGNFEEKKDCE